MKRLRGAFFVHGGLSGVAAAFALLLGACGSNDRVAGGDDFPNSVETLARQGGHDMQDSTEWNAYKDAPSTPPGMYDSTYVPDQAPSSGAGKAALLPDERVVPGREIAEAAREVSTSVAEGVTRTVRIQTVAGVTARDTSWTREDSSGTPRLLRVAGAVAYDDGRSETFSFEDGDGDGFLAPRRAGDVAVARFRSLGTDGVKEEREVRMAAGASVDFNAGGDRTLLELRVVRRAGTDTLIRLVLRPVPGDSVVFDPARDTNRVEVEHEFVRGDGARVGLFYRSVVFADSARNYPVRFRRVIEKDGAREETAAFGRDSLPDFAPGDTGFVHFVRTTAESDSLERAEAWHRVALADTAGRFESNLLLGVERERAYRLGHARTTRFRLAPAVPVADGNLPREGLVEWRLDLRPSGWIEFSGDAGDGEVVGDYLTSRGISGVLRFDFEGNALSP